MNFTITNSACLYYNCILCNIAVTNGSFVDHLLPDLPAYGARNRAVNTAVVLEECTSTQWRGVVCLIVGVKLCDNLKESYVAAKHVRMV